MSLMNTLLSWAPSVLVLQIEGFNSTSEMNSAIYLTQRISLLLLRALPKRINQLLIRFKQTKKVVSKK